MYLFIVGEVNLSFDISSIDILTAIPKGYVYDHTVTERRLTISK